MNLEIIIPFGLTVAGGIWAAYKYLRGEKGKNTELSLANQINQTNAETTQTQMLTSAQHMFAEGLMKDSARIRELVKQLEDGKIADLNALTKLTKELLDAELALKKEKAKAAETEENLEHAEEQVKTLKFQNLGLNTQMIVLNATIQQLESDLRRERRVLGGIDDKVKS